MVGARACSTLPHGAVAAAVWSLAVAAIRLLACGVVLALTRSAARTPSFGPAGQDSAGLLSSAWWWIALLTVWDLVRVSLRLRLLLFVQNVRGVSSHDDDSAIRLPGELVRFEQRVRAQAFVNRFQWSWHTLVLPDVALAGLDTAAFRLDWAATSLAALWQVPVGAVLLASWSGQDVAPAALGGRGGSISSTGWEGNAVAVFVLVCVVLAAIRMLMALSCSSARCIQDGCRPSDSLACIVCCCFRRPLPRARTRPDDGSVTPLPSAGWGSLFESPRRTVIFPSNDSEDAATRGLPVPPLTPAAIGRLRLLAVQPAAGSCPDASNAGSGSPELSSSRRPSVAAAPLALPAGASAPTHPSAHAEAPREGDSCSICLSALEVGQSVRRLEPCMHAAFHSECADRWLGRTATCPVCRAAVVPPRPAPGVCSKPTAEKAPSQGSDQGLVVEKDAKGDAAGGAAAPRMPPSCEPDGMAGGRC